MKKDGKGRTDLHQNSKIQKRKLEKHLLRKADFFNQLDYPFGREQDSG